MYPPVCSGNQPSGNDLFQLEIASVYRDLNQPEKMIDELLILWYPLPEYRSGSKYASGFYERMRRSRRYLEKVLIRQDPKIS
jgi:hypothetical protein